MGQNLEGRPSSQLAERAVGMVCSSRDELLWYGMVRYGRVLLLLYGMVCMVCMVWTGRNRVSGVSGVERRCRLEARYGTVRCHAVASLHHLQNPSGREEGRGIGKGL